MTRAAFEPSSDLSQCDSVVALWSCRSGAMTLQEPSSSRGAQSEALVFLSFFGDVPDPRQPGKVVYPLQEVLLLCLLAVLAGAECFVEIARFGEKKIELLRRFLPFKEKKSKRGELAMRVYAGGVVNLNTED